MIDILEKHDPGRSHKEALKAIAKAKEMEQRIASSGAELCRIPIRGGYIMTNRPHQWEPLRGRSSAEATLVERDVEMMKTSVERSRKASEISNRKMAARRSTIKSHIEEELLEDK